MALKYSSAAIDAQLDALETFLGAAPILRLYNGSVPAGPGASLGAATKIAEGTLPSDAFAAASGGTKAKSGSWGFTGVTAAGAGTAAQFFRLYKADGTTSVIQGTVTVTAGGGDMTLDNANVADGQVGSVGTCTITGGNA